MQENEERDLSVKGIIMELFIGPLDLSSSSAPFNQWCKYTKLTISLTLAI